MAVPGITPIQGAAARWSELRKAGRPLRHQLRWTRGPFQNHAPRPGGPLMSAAAAALGAVTVSTVPAARVPAGGPPRRPRRPLASMAAGLSTRLRGATVKALPPPPPPGRRATTRRRCRTCHSGSPVLHLQFRLAPGQSGVVSRSSFPLARLKVHCLRGRSPVSGLLSTFKKWRRISLHLRSLRSPIPAPCVPSRCTWDDFFNRVKQCQQKQTFHKQKNNILSTLLVRVPSVLISLP